MSDRFTLALQTIAPERMKEARMMLNTDIKTGAALMGMGARMLAMVEKQERPATISMVFRCAQAYGVSIDYLLGLVDDPDNRGADVRKMSRWLFAQFEDIRKQQDAELINRVAERFEKTEAFAKQLADLARETWCAMEDFVGLNPDFEGQRGGAKLQHRIVMLKQTSEKFDECLRKLLPVRD